MVRFILGFLAGCAFTVAAIYALVAWLAANGWNGIQ